MYAALEAEEELLGRGEEDTLPPPGVEMSRFVGELERRWPSLDEDPAGSPWACWPLWQPIVGGGTALNVAWSRADEVYAVVREVAADAGVIVFDPQAEELLFPPG